VLVLTGGKRFELIFWNPEDAFDACGIVDRDLDVSLRIESRGRVDRLAFHKNSADSINSRQARLFEDCVQPPDNGAIQISP